MGNMKPAGYVLLFPWISLALWVPVSFFVYRESQEWLGVLFLGILYDVILFISIIPFCGVILQIPLIYIAFLGISTLTGIYPTWLTGIMFLINAIIGSVLTPLTTREFIIVLKYYYRHKRYNLLAIIVRETPEDCKKIAWDEFLKLRPHKEELDIIVKLAPKEYSKKAREILSKR